MGSRSREHDLGRHDPRLAGDGVVQTHPVNSTEDPDHGHVFHRNFVSAPV